MRGSRSPSPAADGRDDRHLIPRLERLLLSRRQVLLVQAQHKAAAQFSQLRELQRGPGKGRGRVGAGCGGQPAGLARPQSRAGTE